MLIEIWEKIRGYDKWVEATARIDSSTVKKTAHYGRDGSVSYTWASQEELVWTDIYGQRQNAEFKVDDESPLYQLVGGENISIRYNPSKAKEFYFRELLKSRVRRFFQLTFYTCIFLLVLACLFWLNVYTHSRS